MAPPGPPKPQPSPTPGVRVVGGKTTVFGDSYHALLRMPWWGALLSIVAVYLALNALFAVGYLFGGGVANAHHRSFGDAFFFSVQTMGTVGYGAMFPTSTFANVLVVCESVTGLIVTALATGLVFTKFSQSGARVVFTKVAVIGLMDGVPTLMFRLGNQRTNRILEAMLRLVMIRTEKTKEGVTFYRMVDVPLARERSPAMARSWTAMHVITEDSPLHGQTPESLAALEVELLLTLVGVDDTSLQPVHAQMTYDHTAIVWGARHADILSEEADGTLVLNLRKFHDIVFSEPTPDFPYPRPPSPLRVPGDTKTARPDTPAAPQTATRAR
jgi:inward rectifier potassium channel